MREWANKKILIDAQDFRPIMKRNGLEGRSVVLCHGVYDVLHPGHLAHLEEAKSHGDVLVVSVARDEDVQKGPGRPIFTQAVRMRQLAALELVDFVVPSSPVHADKVILSIRPDVYARGADFPTGPNPDTNAVNEIGCKLVLTTAPTDSSSRLSVEVFSSYPLTTERWLTDFKKRYSASVVLEALDALKDMRVLVIGEGSKDECITVKSLGALPGDLFSSGRILSVSNQPQVTDIIAAHINGFTKNVKTITQASPVKARFYVEEPNWRPIFASLDIPEPLLQSGEEGEILSQLNTDLDWAELVIVADYGIGLMTPNILKLIAEKAKFLAATIKMYHGNCGINNAGKYHRMDYFSINEFEYQHSVSMGVKFADAPLMITNADKGSRYIAPNCQAIETPSLALNIVDPCGAGDAHLAYGSALAARGVDPNILSFVAACAAGIHCKVRVNEKPVCPNELKRAIIRLL